MRQIGNNPKQGSARSAGVFTRSNACNAQRFVTAMGLLRIQHCCGCGHPRSAPTSAFFIRPLICALLLCLAISASAAPGLTASLDRNVISLGESATLTLVFEGLNPGGAPTLPAIPGITVAGTGQSSEFTIVNGQAESKLVFTYTLVPSQAGDITIPTMRTRINNRDFTTPPLKLKVLAGSAIPPQEAANKYGFLRLIVPKTNLFVGEPLPVDINFYYIYLADARRPQVESAGITVGDVQQQRTSTTLVGNQPYNLMP